MAVINMTVADLQRGRLLSPGWYTAKVKNITVKASKDGGSTNYNYTFEIPSEKAEVDNNFNSKAMGRFAPLISAIEDEPIMSIVEKLNGNNYSFDTDDHLGATVQILIEHETFDGTTRNKVVNFLPEGAETI